MTTNGYSLFFHMIFLVLGISDSCAMQPSLPQMPSTIIKTIPIVRPGIEAIACLKNEDGKLPVTLLILAVGGSCIGYDYMNQNINFHEFYAKNSNPARIDTHPYKNIFCVNNFLYNGETGEKYFIGDFKDEHANVLFDTEGPILFTVQDKSINCYNYERALLFANIVTSLGLLFTKSSQKRYFLCSDDMHTGIYKIVPELTSNGSGLITQKIFDFCVPLNLTHWAYSPRLEVFCAVTQYDRSLYVADMKTCEQKIWPHDESFKVGTLAFLPNQRILVLLSSSKNRICYIDGKRLQPIITTTHPVSYIDKSSIQCGQILAVSRNGHEIFLALADKCLVIKIPSWVREFDAYEKYCEIIRRLNIPQELQWLIAIQLVSSIIFNKK